MKEDRIDAGGIPTRLYDPGGAKGLLLLGHGGAHGKDAERFVELGRQYATATGLAVVCIDAVDHGERKPSGPVPPGLPTRWHSRVLPQMVADWQRVSAELARVGPPLAYVGFSMGSIFGPSTVIGLPSIRAAVFVVGGLPGGGWVDDPPLSGLLLGAAAQLAGPEVLMVNMSRDEVFPTQGTIEVFNAIPGQRKRLVFWDGGHGDWPADAISDTITFINRTLTTAIPSEEPATTR